MSNLSTSETVLALDRFQFTADKRVCPQHPFRGAMGVHASGAHFVCGFKGCEYGEPVNSETLSTASQLK